MALVAVAGALAAPAPAAARLLVATYNEGLQPHAELQGHTRAIERPKQLRVEISGLVKAEVEGSFTIECSRRGVTKFRRAYTVSGMSPAARVVPVSARWDACRVSRAEARFTDQFVEGWIQIRAWGTSR